MKTYSSLDEKKQFLQIIDVNTLDDLWAFIDNVKKNNNYVFRGVNEAKYMCYSSAQVRTGALLKQDDYELMIDDAISKVKKSTIIMDYLNEYSGDKTDFQILALMQHYGYGTPIIDYSTNIDSALFFATDRQNEKVQTASPDDHSIDAYISIYFFDLRDPDHCSIQVINDRGQKMINKLDFESKKSYGSHYLGISKQTIDSIVYMPFRELVKIDNKGLFSVLGNSNGVVSFNLAGQSVEYNIDNERIEAQDGLFIFNGDSKIPYEEASFNWYSGIKNYCVNIHKSLEGEIKQYLVEKGINKETIYPESKESDEIIKELKRLHINKKLKPLK